MYCIKYDSYLDIIMILFKLKSNYCSHQMAKLILSYTSFEKEHSILYNVKWTIGIQYPLEVIFQGDYRPTLDSNNVVGGPRSEN